MHVCNVFGEERNIDEAARIELIKPMAIYVDNY